MKTQAKKELHTKSISELMTQLKDAREALRVMRLDREMGRLKNTSSLTGKRVEIAVIQTIMRKKTIEQKEEKASPEGKKSTITSSSTPKATAGKRVKAVKSIRKSQDKGGKK